MNLPRFVPVGAVVLAAFLTANFAAESPGYYRYPALADDAIVFVAEGDLWRVADTGGTATRLTSHPGDESFPAVSPDGRTVAFVASYEGPTEVYTMPLSGGLPVRWTYGAGRIAVVGWTPDGRVLYTTNAFSTLPDYQLATLDVSRPGQAGEVELFPLAQAADGCLNGDGSTLYFTRLAFQGSHTKRYQGGTAQNLWSFTEGDAEARPLTADYPGTSKRPMCEGDRIIFASDRDGTMNLWSMNRDGDDLRQLTHHQGWDVKSPSARDGRIVYQLGADIHLYDVATGTDRQLSISLDSDFDQMRDNWVEKPMSYLTAVHPSPEGDRVVITARGRVFVAPHKQGRLAEAGRRTGVRYRDARFMPDGKTLLALSDESGEVELWTLPANGVGPSKRLTDDGEVLRWRGVPSPDGKRIAHYDKNQRLFVLGVDSGENREIDRSEIGDFADLAWSPDGMWLAYVKLADNMFGQVKLYGVADGKVSTLTSERYDTYSPAWSPDGEWLYVLSDRNLRSIVGSPWGNYQPEPFLDKKTRVYQIALREGLRSPFAPRDELHADESKTDDERDGASAPGSASDKRSKKKKDESVSKTGEKAAERKVDVRIDLDGIERRLIEVPLEPGNYSALSLNDKTLFWLSRSAGERELSLQGLKITRDEAKVKTVAEGVKSYELAAKGDKLLVRKGDDLFLVDAKPDKAELKDEKVDLSAWAFYVDPREEWRQMFVEAWRLERDYFYDRGMHGVDWPAMRRKYEPLVDRVTSRAELSDLMAQMVSELSALHTFVHGGDTRHGQDRIAAASLGARLARDEQAGGYRVEHVYRSDPDDVDRRSPLSAPGVAVAEGDVVLTVNGLPTLSAPDIGVLLRNQAGRQVLLRVDPADGGDDRDVIVRPLTESEAADLRYHEWEYTRRLEVEERGAGDIGYVHLRAMGGGNFTEWAKGFYPVFDRKGLIVDVRHNRGGNIDSWILGRLLRQAWFDWSQRVGRSPMWNMQYAFRGHVVVLCDERTASDGEAFTEGIRRLGIGKIIGTRTWGGEIWLSSSNVLVDRGIATAAEYGVYGPEGDWLIEGHGVEPDIVVDNLPHATYLGRDAQLEAAIDYLEKQIAEHPVEVPPVPAYPDKSFP